MAIIAMLSAPHCGGEELAVEISRQLGYERVEKELLRRAADLAGAEPDDIVRAMAGPPPFFNRFTHVRERHVACARVALAEIIRRDNILHNGLASLLLPHSITHALRICIVATLTYREERARAAQAITTREATQRIRREDAVLNRWSRYLLDRDPFDHSLYDIVLPMHDRSLADAVNDICEKTEHDAVRSTAAAQAAVEDFVLAARVHLVLAEKGHEVEVRADSGQVKVLVNRYVSNLDRLEAKLIALAQTVEGVARVECAPGPRFVPPSLLRTPDLESPRKILLVDDETDFVHTLSERLSTRDLHSEIVYDGEQALACVREDPPEVMVLDLKMPGIDGIEVLRQVKQERPEIEVIILTGHGSVREEELAAQLGAFAYLRKPVDVDELSRTMQAAYRRYKSRL
jgi:CheY-like chemotaxis protein/cytidylate kinase